MSASVSNCYNNSDVFLESGLIVPHKEVAEIPKVVSNVGDQQPGDNSLEFHNWLGITAVIKQ
jgi:hypothetical protein